MNQMTARASLCAALFIAGLPGAKAATIHQDGSAIVIGADTPQSQSLPQPAIRFDPSEACVLPLPPVGNAEQETISDYQAKRQKFMDCVARDPLANQQNLDRSLAAIGDDSLQATDIIQQELPRSGRRH